MAASKELRALLAATIQACGAKWGAETIPVILEDLAVYPEERIVTALHRCRKELKFTLTLADIVERIDDGRPAADEAWAQVSAGLDENATVIATDEALEALGEVRGLASDQNAVRMGFREAYRRIVLRNKAVGITPQWVPSLGHDPEQREQVLRKAADKGRLEHGRIHGLLGAATDPLRAGPLALPPRSEEDMIEEGQKQVTDLLATLSNGLRADRKRQQEHEPRYDWRAEEERLAQGDA